MSKPQADQPIVDIGDLAAEHVGTWATSTGITINEATRDRNGWDYIFEFASTKAQSDEADLLDLRPPLFTCKIQVKGTKKSDRRVKVKLSNWERFAKEPIPCFFVIVEFDPNNTPLSLHVIHVSEDWIERVLKRLRRLNPSEGDRLHNKSLDLVWDESTRLASTDGRALRTSILDAVGLDPRAYASKKMEWVKRVGFEERPIRANIKFKTTDMDSHWRMVADFAIGLIKSLPIDEFKADEIRFGIPRRVLHRSGGTGEIEFKELPSAGRATVILYDESMENRCEIECTAYSAQHVLPFIPDKYQKIRFSGDRFALNISKAGASITFTLPSATATDAMPMSQLARVSKAFLMASRAPSKGLRVDVKMQHAKSTCVWLEAVESDPEATELAAAAVDASFVVSRSDVGFDPIVTPRSIFMQRANIRGLRAACERQATGVEAVVHANPGERLPTGETGIVMLCPLFLGSHVFLARLCIVGLPSPLTAEDSEIRGFKVTGTEIWVDGTWLTRRDEHAELNPDRLLEDGAKNLDSRGLAHVCVIQPQARPDLALVERHTPGAADVASPRSVAPRQRRRRRRD